MPNGLALCSLHHKALDVGAIGLARRGNEIELLVSCVVNGRSAAVAQLLDCRGLPLARAQSPWLAPKPEFVRWHRREVFREPALQELARRWGRGSARRRAGQGPDPRLMRLSF